MLSVALVVTLALPACKKDVRVVDCAADEASLRDVIASDKHTGSLLHGVDDLAVKGKPSEAVTKIEREVVPAGEHAKQQAEAFAPRTRWGAERKAELVALVDDRQKATEAYAEALRSKIIQRLVEQMERQTEIERRAIKVEQSVLSVPAAGSGACGPP